MLNCRICESTHPLAPLSSCAACSGPLDVHYAWNGSRTALQDRENWSYDALLPHGGDGHAEPHAARPRAERSPPHSTSTST